MSTLWLHSTLGRIIYTILRVTKSFSGLRRVLGINEFMLTLLPKSWRFLCGNSTPCSFSLPSILQGCSRFLRTLSQIASFVLTVLGCKSSLRWMAVIKEPGRRAGLLTWSVCLNRKPSALVHTLRAFQKGRPFHFSLECLTPQDQSFRTPKVQTEQEACQYQISIPYFLFFHSFSWRQSYSPFFRKTQNPRCIWIQRDHQLDVFLNSHTASLLNLAEDTSHIHHLNGASELQYAGMRLNLHAWLWSNSQCMYLWGSSWSVRFM